MPGISLTISFFQIKNNNSEIYQTVCHTNINIVAMDSTPVTSQVQAWLSTSAVYVHSTTPGSPQGNTRS